MDRGGAAPQTNVPAVRYVTLIGTAYRQAVTRDLVSLHGDQRSAHQIASESGKDLQNQFDNLRGAQSLDS